MSPTGKLSPRVGELRGPGGTAAPAPRRPGNGPPGLRLQPRSGRGVGVAVTGQGGKGGSGGRAPAEWRPGRLGGEVHKLRAPQPRSAEVSATGAQGAPAPAIVAGPCGRRLQAGPSPRIPRPARPAPGAAAAGTRTSCRRGRVHPGGRPPAAVIVRRAPPTSAVPAAPGPGCVLRAAGLARARRRRRARGPRGRRARELGRRRPAEVRAIKGGAGRRGGRSRRGGWGARSGSPWPPRRPAGAPLARRGAAQSGRRPRPRPAPSSPRSPLSAAAAPAPGPAASEAGEREVRGTTAPPRAWAGPSAGGAWAQPGDSGEPQPPPASEP